MLLVNFFAINCISVVALLMKPANQLIKKGHIRANNNKILHCYYCYGLDIESHHHRRQIPPPLPLKYNAVRQALNVTQLMSHLVFVDTISAIMARVEIYQ
eukprot:274955_1